MKNPSRIEFPNGTVLIDLTSDTVTPDKMFFGTTAHASNGDIITGTAKVTDDGQGHVSLPSGFVELSGG